MQRIRDASALPLTVQTSEARCQMIFIFLNSIIEGDPFQQWCLPSVSSLKHYQRRPQTFVCFNSFDLNSFYDNKISNIFASSF